MSTIRFIARKKIYNESKCDQFIQILDRERRDTRLDETRFRLCLPVSTKTKCNTLNLISPLI